MQRASAASPGLARAGAVLGVGIGGLFDGIVFHQILQWHHMISATTPPTTLAALELNTLLDGLFHGAAWVMTVLGLWLLQAAAMPAQNAGRIVAGAMTVGWGAFNLVEGVLDHYILGIHHVRPGPDEALYDLVFLAWGGLFVAVGWLMARR